MSSEAWLPLAEAAKRLAISDDAARKRCERGMLRCERRGRRLFVAFDTIGPESDTDATRADHRDDIDRTAVELLRSENTYLREALEAEREARKRADHLLAGMIERMPALMAGGEIDPVRDAPVAANKGSEAAKTVRVGEDAETPAASPWSRFWRWLRGQDG